MTLGPDRLYQSLPGPDNLAFGWRTQPVRSWGFTTTYRYKSGSLLARGAGALRGTRDESIETMLYGGLHQKFCTPIFLPEGQLMEQNPKESPKTHSHIHTKAIKL